MAETYGWAGKILRVNLTTGEITTQDDAKYHKYIGGMGMAYRIMYEEAPMELDPYDEKALVIFGVGPLTGAGVPCSGRMNVTFRSTWSKGHSIIDAHMGGHIGSMLKYAGYDGIVVSGISEKPVYLRIEDGEVSLEDASEIWGKGTFAANKWMVEQCFVTSEADVAAWGTDDGCRRAARLYYEAICEYFGTEPLPGT